MLYGKLALTQFSVLFGLGGVLVVCALFIRLNKNFLFVMGLAVILLTQILPQWLINAGVYGKPLVIMLLVPKLTGTWLNMYPVFPWMGISLLGMVFAKEIIANRKKAFTRLLFAGLICLVLFPIVRWAGGFGNFQKPAGSDMIDFFNIVKYPPSLVYTLLTLGINSVILYLFETFQQRLPGLQNPLLVFGKTALYFYLAHWFLFFGFGMPFYFIKGNFAWLYGCWLLGLFMLYPVCRQYLKFNQQTNPDSVWRFI